MNNYCDKVIESSPSPSTTSSLSPLSSQYAAEYDRDIKSIKTEIRGISSALKLLKKGSKDYAEQSRLLTIAKDELKCALEDRTMFRGFTGANDATGKENSLPIPTPPLGRTGKKAPKNSGTCVRQQFERLQMADDANQQEKQELQISNKSERTMRQNMNINDLTRQLDDISKFSLEWFEIKREIEVIKRRRGRTKQHHSDFRRSI